MAIIIHNDHKSSNSIVNIDDHQHERHTGQTKASNSNNKDDHNSNGDIDNNKNRSSLRRPGRPSSSKKK